VAINLGRVIAGGLAAGAVRILGEVAVRAIFADSMRAQLIRLNPALLAAAPSAAAIVEGVTIQLCFGIAVVFIYAAMRPRFGAGPGTAIRAGLTLWSVASLAYLNMAVAGIFSWGFQIARVSATLVPTLIAAYVGALLYKEAESATRAEPRTGYSPATTA